MKEHGVFDKEGNEIFSAIPTHPYSILIEELKQRIILCECYKDVYVDEKISLDYQRLTGVPSSFWLRMQKRYDENLKHNSKNEKI